MDASFLYMEGYMEPLYVDIETRPACEQELLDLWGQPVIPPDPGIFDPESVKIPKNIKNPAKIQARIDAACIAHEQAVANYEQAIATASANHLGELQRKGTLHAESGQILTISRMHRGQYHIPECSEEEMLREFWVVYEYHRARGNLFIGFNCKEYDFPWMIRRSYCHGIRIPVGILDKDRFWNPCIVDLMAKWTMGCYGAIHKPSLSRMAKAMGHPGKPDSGEFLWKKWDEDRAAAVEYCKLDLDITEFCARKMGIV